MARPTQLQAYMNGHRVGTLQQTASGGLEFSYDRQWLDSSVARPISLSLPLTSEVYRGSTVIDFFDNLLPESGSIRNRIRVLLSASSTETFDLLHAVGGDCVGALQILPPARAPEEEQRSKPLSNHEIATRLQNIRTDPLGMRKEEDFRISLAGVQSKTALLRRDSRWHIPLGSTPTSHIFKLQIGKESPFDPDLSQSVENEFLCSRILRSFGLPAARSEIADFEGIRTLIVERFDRKLDNATGRFLRLPQEDLCQALGLPASKKYQVDGGPGNAEIMNLLLGSANASEDRRNFMKAQLVFWLLAATDGHAKNYSVFLGLQGRYRLTPFYDVISVYPAASANYPRQKWKMALAVRGKKKNHYRWDRIAPRHWLQTAKFCRYDEREIKATLEEIADTCEDALQMATTRLPAGFPDAVAESIVGGVLQARERLRMR